MDNELIYSADATYQKAQYDASDKRLLGQKEDYIGAYTDQGSRRI